MIHASNQLKNLSNHFLLYKQSSDPPQQDPSQFVGPPRPEEVLKPSPRSQDNDALKALHNLLINKPFLLKPPFKPERPTLKDLGIEEPDEAEKALEALKFLQLQERAVERLRQQALERQAQQNTGLLAGLGIAAMLLYLLFSSKKKKDSDNTASKK